MDCPGQSQRRHLRQDASPAVHAGRSLPASLPRAVKRSPSPGEEEAKAYEGSEHNGRKKRCRGRPRMDTRDETAADRRRTQIRLAQRAYRHRKDTAITTLERRVKELERANNDMMEDFSAFLDILVSERVLDGAPRTHHRLSSIAHKITATADQARASNGGASSLSDNDGDEADRQWPGGPYPSPAPPRIASSEPSPPPQSTLQQHAPFLQQAGYTATHGVPVTRPIFANMPSTPCPVPLVHLATPSASCEVMAAATEQMAGFPFYSPMMEEPCSAAAQFGGGLASTPSPYSTLPIPSSLAANELTFGRRLQRFTTECALRLVMSLHPPPERFAAVFGFCLLFETREGITKRLKTTLDSDQHQDLCFWKAPFTNLGGAGTFFPDQPQTKSPSSVTDNGNMPVGNQGTQSYGKPREMTGMSMGPWGPAVQATFDERIDYGVDRRMQMILSGFEGDFFDPDEVETHLRQLGIFIPQRADFVHTEVDMDELEVDEGASPVNSSILLPSRQPFGDSVDSGNGSSAVWATSSNGNSNSNSSSSSSASGVVESSSYPPYTRPVEEGQPRKTQEQPPFSGPAHGSGDGVATAAPQSHLLTPPVAVDTRLWPRPITWPNRVKITLNVGVLIQELVNKSVCLGRSPGVRRKDINTAVKVAAGLAPASR